MKLLHAISGSKWREICLADIGGPGLDLSGNLSCADWSGAKTRV